MRSAAFPGLSFKNISFAVLFYVAATALFFAPSLKSLSGSLIGPPEDNMFFLWSLWYGSGALWKHGTGFMHTHQLFYPEGISLYFCNYYYYGVALTFFLKTFLSLPLIYNLLVLHTFVLAGIGAFLLVYELTRDVRSSLLGGFIFAFNPSHFAHSLHHLTIASIQFIPFFVLFFIRAARGGKKRDILAASFFMALSALCDWNYLVFDLLFIGSALVYLIVNNRKQAVTIFKRLLPVPVLSGLVLSPLIVPMIAVSLKQPFVGELSGHDIFVADFFGFWVPHPYHWLHAASGFVRKLNDAMTGNDWEKSAYLGIVNLIILLTALRWTRKERGKYFLALAGFMILAMGVHAHFLGHSLAFPLPYRLIQEIPFLTQARNPSRMMVYAYLFLAILVGFSAKEIILRVSRPTVAKIVTAAIFLAVFFDFYSVSSAVTPVTLPSAYREIQKDAEKNFGILELPWEGARYMMYQTLHGIPCVQGYMGRRLEKTLSDRLVYDPSHLEIQKGMLISSRVKYIVLYKRRLDWDASKAKDKAYEMLLSRVGEMYSRTYEKIREDENCAVYRVY